MQVKFKPDLTVVKTVEALSKPLPIGTLAAEPSLFSATVEYAREVGGPLVQQVLDALEGNEDIAKAKAAGLHPVIDVRVQRLMPGMYPSIPGWHCDAVPRSGYHAQPDFDKIHPDSVHFTLIASTAGDGVSATEFLDEELSSNFDEKEPIWQQLHRAIERIRGFALIEGGKLKMKQVKNGQLARFSTLTPHRTMPTTTRGWRMFFRLSMYHNPPVANGIPSQQQVYILSEENGW